MSDPSDATMDAEDARHEAERATGECQRCMLPVKGRLYCRACDALGAAPPEVCPVCQNERSLYGNGCDEFTCCECDAQFRIDDIRALLIGREVVRLIKAGPAAPQPGVPREISVLFAGVTFGGDVMRYARSLGVPYG